MNSLTDSSSSLHRTLRSAEWALLLMVTLIYAIDQYFYKIQILPDLFLKAAIFNALFFGLSFVFPIDRPLWQRRAYVALEITLIVIARTLWVELDVILYVLLIKSCFLLSRREVLFTVVVTGIGYLISVTWTMPYHAQWATETLQSTNAEELYKPQALILGTVVEYVGISLFVILLGFVIVAERKSRYRAQALTQEVETLAIALERSRIARDIHDSLGHSLTTLNVQLELVQEMGQRDPDRASQALHNAQLLASQCLEAVRRAVQTVRQHEFNLNEGLNALIEQVRHTRSLVIQSEINLPGLPLQTAHQLYCIVQEGLTNIQKHAGASHITVRGHVTSDKIVLELEDDGRGFEPTKPHTGYGLRGMAERVHLLGGTLKIDSALGAGTQIQVVIPKSST